MVTALTGSGLGTTFLPLLILNGATDSLLINSIFLSFKIMPKAILPWKLKQFQQSTATDYNTTLGEPGSNAKTEKNAVLTFTHNLSPADTSGVINVCPGAGNCKKTCLHWAGNPAYMKGKQAKRKHVATVGGTKSKLSQKHIQEVTGYIIDKLHAGVHINVAKSMIPIEIKKMRE